MVLQWDILTVLESAKQKADLTAEMTESKKDICSAAKTGGTAAEATVVRWELATVAPRVNPKELQWAVNLVVGSIYT